MTRSCFKNAGNDLHHYKIHAGIFSLQILFVSRETVLSMWWFGVVNICGLGWFICGVGLKWQVDVIKTPFMFLFLFIKRLHSCLNIMSLVAVEKRKSGKNRKDRNKVDRKVRKKGKFPACVFSSSLGSRPIRLQ